MYRDASLLFRVITIMFRVITIMFRVVTIKFICDYGVPNWINKQIVGT